MVTNTTPRAGTNWSVNSQPWNGGNGQILGGGGDPTAFPTGASRLDKIRMGDGQLPDAQYPAGYLGNYQSKHQRELGARLDDRSYQRGVHKFVKMTPDEYRWPRDFGPGTGLRRQAATATPAGNVILCQNQGPSGDAAERYRSYMQGGDVPSSRDMAELYRRYGINVVTGQGTDSVDPARKAVIAKMAPGLSW